MKTINIDGKVYDWREIRRLRREQIQAARRAEQLELFEIYCGRAASYGAHGFCQYEEPSLPFKE